MRRQRILKTVDYGKGWLFDDISTDESSLKSTIGIVPNVVQTVSRNESIGRSPVAAVVGLNVYGDDLNFDPVRVSAGFPVVVPDFHLNQRRRLSAATTPVCEPIQNNDFSSLLVNSLGLEREPIPDGIVTENVTRLIEGIVRTGYHSRPQKDAGLNHCYEPQVHKACKLSVDHAHRKNVSRSDVLF